MAHGSSFQLRCASRVLSSSRSDRFSFQFRFVCLVAFCSSLLLRFVSFYASFPFLFVFIRASILHPPPRSERKSRPRPSPPAPAVLPRQRGNGMWRHVTWHWRVMTGGHSRLLRVEFRFFPVNHPTSFCPPPVPAEFPPSGRASRPNQNTQRNCSEIPHIAGNEIATKIPDRSRTRSH